GQADRDIVLPADELTEQLHQLLVGTRGDVLREMRNSPRSVGQGHACVHPTWTAGPGVLALAPDCWRHRVRKDGSRPSGRDNSDTPGCPRPLPSPAGAAACPG